MALLQSDVTNTSSNIQFSWDKLPVDWQRMSIGDHFYIQQGKAVSKAHRKNINPRPFLRTANVFWGHLDLSVLDQMDFSKSEEIRFELKKNDLLVCEGGDIGRTALLSEELGRVYYQNHLHRLRAKTDRVIPEFVLYWLWAGFKVFNLYSGEGNKTTIPNLSQSRLSSLIFPLPPVEEQKTIAQVLTSIREAIEATEKVIEAARELKKSMMKHLFTYGPVSLNEIHQVELKETEIGLIPDDWQIVKIKDIGTVVTGSTPSTNSPDYFSGDFPFVTPGDLGECVYVEKTSRTLSGKGIQQVRSIPKNSVMVSCIGNIGKAGITTKELNATNQQINSVICKEQILPLFFYYSIVHLAPRLSEKAGKVTIPIVNKSNFQDFCVMKPALDEQGLISKALLSIDRKIEVEIVTTQAGSETKGGR